MRKFLIKVNGQPYEVEVEEMGVAQTAQPVPAAPQPVVSVAPKAAPAPAAPADGTKVEAPMPGTILDIQVSVGKAVKEGDVLAILEAMKMENEIMAPCAGTVKSVLVSKGASVESGDLIVVIG